jgi:hypothetical protein
LESVQFSTGWSAVCCQTEAFCFCCFAKVVLCATKSPVEASSHSAATSKALGQEFSRTHRGQEKQVSVCMMAQFLHPSTILKPFFAPYIHKRFVVPVLYAFIPQAFYQRPVWGYWGCSSSCEHLGCFHNLYERPPKHISAHSHPFR